jgi:hypothetical protein
MSQSNNDFKKIWTDKCSKYKIDSQPNILPAVRRVIVIGDIHGDWEMCIKSLKVAKLINEKNDWIGKDTVVVQVGDQIDRCRYNGIPCNDKLATEQDENSDWKILQYFTNLHHQAQKVGGAVYSLIGNHELMNVRGDFRYVSYEGLVNFKYNDNIGEQARRDAFSPGNPISDFLACTRQMALIIGPNLFVHAGIIPSIAEKYSIKDLNQIMSLYLLNKLEYNDIIKYNDIFNSAEHSPLWTRVFGNIAKQKYNKGLNYSYSADSKLYCAQLLDPLEKVYKVNNIIVGHTPLIDNGIGNICDERIWLTDFGLSKAFDQFDKYAIVSSSDSGKYNRSSYREAQVLEILNEGRQFNILK